MLTPVPIFSRLAVLRYERGSFVQQLPLPAGTSYFGKPNKSK